MSWKWGIQETNRGELLKITPSWWWNVNRKSSRERTYPPFKRYFWVDDFSSFIDGICIRFVGGYPSICDHRLSTGPTPRSRPGVVHKRRISDEILGFSFRWQFSPGERICFSFLGDLFLFGFFPEMDFDEVSKIFFAEKESVGKRPWLWKRLWIWDRMVMQKTIQSLFGGRIFSSWFTFVQTS